MKKLLVCAAVLSMSGMALAAIPAGFDFVGTMVEVTPGTPVAIPLTVSSAGAIGGVDLYMESTDPFQIDTILCDNAGTVWNTTTVPATSSGNLIYDYSNSSSFLTRGQALLVVTTATGTINVAPGDVMAKILVSVPVGTPIGTQGSLSTFIPSWNTGSDFTTSDVVGQDSITLVVVPEPMTALLLLAGLPLLRRRHA